MTYKFKDEAEVRWALEKIQQDVAARELHTPDHNKLCSYHTQFLFLPCEYRRGQPLHDLIQGDVTRLHTAYTERRMYMWEYDRGKGSYPFVLEPNPELDRWTSVKSAVVCGDLYKVQDPRVFFNLDSLRENGVRFQRKMVPLLILSKQQRWYRDIYKAPDYMQPISNFKAIDAGWHHTYTRAHMYVGVPEFWMPLIDGGHSFKPVPRYTPNSWWTEDFFLYRKNGY